MRLLGGLRRAAFRFLPGTEGAPPLCGKRSMPRIASGEQAKAGPKRPGFRFFSKGFVFPRGAAALFSIDESGRHIV